jgi:hypothetical protein
MVRRNPDVLEEHTKISEANQPEARCNRSSLPVVGFFLGLFFDTEVRDDKFPLNMGLSPIVWALEPL